MRSPPTLPRRRGRLQPDPKCCGPGSDGLTECDYSKQHSAHPRLPQVDASTAWPQRVGPHSRKRRSIFCALSKFLAASSPIGSISVVEARSAPLKSVPLTVTRASVAPPKAAPRSEALVRCEFEVHARQIRLAQDCALEVARF